MERSYPVLASRSGPGAGFRLILREESEPTIYERLLAARPVVLSPEPEGTDLLLAEQCDLGQSSMLELTLLG